MLSSAADLNPPVATSPPPAHLVQTKLALRRGVRAGRAARSQQQVEATAAAIAAVCLELDRVRRAGCVAVYASLPDEPGTAALRGQLRQLRVRVLLPIVAEGRALDWAEDAGELAPAGSLRLPEPAGPRLGPTGLRAAQVILVPALAVDTAGTRLGRGRGYYDGALVHADPAALILALVHDEEVVDAASTPIPREPHDIGVHGAITPTRWMFFSPSRR